MYVMFYFCIDYFMGCNYIHGPHLIYTIQRVCSFYHYHCYFYYNYNYFTIINIISLHITNSTFECCLLNEVYFYAIEFISSSSLNFLIWFLFKSDFFVIWWHLLSFLFRFCFFSRMCISLQFIPQQSKKYQHELEMFCETHYPNIKFHSFCILFFFFFCFFYT